jgi:hypothetical protein
MQAAQIWRSDDDMPKALFPMINRSGTINPMSGPATYQGQGCESISTKRFIILGVGTIKVKNSPDGELSLS